MWNLKSVVVFFLFEFLFCLKPSPPPNISIHILHTHYIYISQGADKENLFNNQELF